MGDTILVIGKTKRSAYHKLDSILGELKYKEVESVNKGNYSYRVYLKNGDVYFATRGIESAIRGISFDKVLLDIELDKNLIQKYILPFISDPTNVVYWKESYE